MSKIISIFIKSWRNLAFSERIALVSIVVGTFVFLTSISFVAFMYRSDKEAYLYELQMLRARSASNTYSSSLSNSKAYGKKLVLSSDASSIKSLGLARLPEGEEVFVVSGKILAGLLNVDLSKDKKKMFSVFRDVNGDLMYSASVLPEPELEDGTMHVLTADGLLISSSGTNVMTQSRVKENQAIKVGLASNLTESTNTIEYSETKVIVSQKEVPHTNVFVFAEVPVSSLMMPFWKMLQLWVIFGYVLILAGAAVSYIITKKVAAPTREAADHILKLTRGDFSIRTSYKNTDEFQVIFSGIDFLAEHVQLRERRLTAFVSGLGTILSKSAVWEENWDIDEFYRNSCKLLGGLLSGYKLRGFEMIYEGDTAFYDLELNSLVLGFDSAQSLLKVHTLKVLSHSGKLQMEFRILAGSSVDFLPETLQILTQFSETVASYFDRRRAAAAHKEKREQEREILLAAEIQRSLVNYPEIIPGVNFKNVYVPAGHVGGDWSSAYYNSSSGWMYFFVGDATGHGIASSLVTAVVGGASRLFNKIFGEATFTDDNDVAMRLADLSVNLNEIVLEAGSNKIGMTMILGALNSRSGKLTLLNLGHPSPVWYAPKGVADVEKPILPNNNLLGSSEFSLPRSKTFQLVPGQGFILFTDGLLENYSGKLKRKELKNLLTGASDISSAVEGVTQKYHSLADGQLAGDDVAILGVQWLGNIT